MSLDYMDIDLVVIILIIYIFIVATIAKVGSNRKCGGTKALAISLLFTPVAGLFYTLSSPPKNTLKITHYQCSRCGLEYTTRHKYCPSCLKDGEEKKLERISMRTY